MKVVGVGIAIHDGRALICKRKSGTVLAGWWEFPGGKVKSGETAVECVEREFEEEMGVKCSVDCYLDQTQWQYSHGTFIIKAYVVTLLSINVHANVHSICKWVPFDKLDSYEILPSNSLFVSHLKKGIKNPQLLIGYLKEQIRTKEFEVMAEEAEKEYQIERADGLAVANNQAMMQLKAMESDLEALKKNLPPPSPQVQFT